MKLTAKEKSVLKEAEAIYERLAQAHTGEFLNSPELVANIFKARLVGEEREHFEVAYLDQQHQLLTTERIFSGTVNQASVHPREIAKRCLELNAAAAILAHNHPSGNTSPSDSDLSITKQIKDALKMFEVRVLDHIIIGTSGRWHSMAQANQI
ncbi:JAB domain-containing protein [Thiomicrospira sp.]|uniref:JAB domain-containing protein n=1 Tax=Thiomicrospira sp. TaxID=935 RepID=UPI002F94D2BC